MWPVAAAATLKVFSFPSEETRPTMPDFLIIYASKHGHTAKIAERIADGVCAAGGAADVREIATASKVRPSDYDGVIVGASIHAGHHQSELRAWARHHAIELSAIPSAFFSVCLTAADDNDESAETSRRYIDEFVDETGWTPDRTVTFAGAIQYEEYDFVTRLMMRLIMKRGGHPTDTSHDYDYTDWEAVKRFGHECAGAAVPVLVR